MTEVQDVQAVAKEMSDELPEEVDATTDEIVERLKSLLEYDLTMSNAREQVARKYRKEAGVGSGEGTAAANQENDVVPAGEVNRVDEWIDLEEVKVVSLFDSDSDAVAQMGSLGDETGTVRFVSWAKSDLRQLEEDEVYTLRNVVTDEYQGEYQVKMNSKTEIESSDEDVTVETGSECVGVIVDTQSGTGLIERCPTSDCSRVLDDGDRCKEHGEVDGEYDLRIKAVIDNGEEVQEIVADRDMTESLIGMSLSEAKELAMQEMDSSVVGQKISDQLVGQYYRVSGPVVGRYLLVDEITEDVEPHDIDSLLIEARSI